MSYHLRKALRAVHLADSFKDRQEFFEHYVQRSLSARAILFLYRFIRLSPLSALMFTLFGMRYIFRRTYTRSGRYALVSPGDYVNEKRAICEFLKIVGDELIEEPLRWTARVRFFLGDPKFFLRLFRFLRHYERRGTFLTCCRISETLWLYACAHWRLEQLGATGIITATNYSPTACALIAAGRVRQIPVIYIFHALIPHDAVMPALEADLAYLYSKKAIEAFDQYHGVRCKQIHFCGLPGISVPMTVAKSFEGLKTIGVFLTAYTIQKAFEQLIADLSADPNLIRIIIRPHPLKEANPGLGFVSGYPKVEIDQAGRACDTAQRCDAVIAGSSSVHVEVLKAGTPSLYWEAFDTIGPDYYRFIRDGIVLELRDGSELNWDEIREYYGDEWITRFQELDCSYLREPEGIRSAMRIALEGVLNRADYEKFGRDHRLQDGEHLLGQQGT